MQIKKNLAIIAAAGLTLALIVIGGWAGWTAVAAQTPPATGAPPTGAKVVTARGKITALRNDGFTIDTPQGTVNVSVNAQTWIIRGARDGSTEGTLADLPVGAGVTVAGTSPAAGQIAARLVQEGPGLPGMGAPPDARGKPGPGPARPGGALRGTIAALDGTTITLTLDNNRTLAVRAGAGTIILKNGFAALSDLKVGDTLVVDGPLMGPPAGRGRGPGMPPNGMPPGPGGARRGPGMPGGHPGPPPNQAAPPNPAAPPAPMAVPAAVLWVPQDGEQVLHGMVVAVDGATLTVRGPEREFKVQAGDNTAYKRMTGADQAPATAARSDITANTPVLILGTAADNQPVTAKAIVLLPGPPAAPGAPPQP
jgi:hypothetical protein